MNNTILLLQSIFALIISFILDLIWGIHIFFKKKNDVKREIKKLAINENKKFDELETKQKQSRLEIEEDYSEKIRIQEKDTTRQIMDIKNNAACRTQENSNLKKEIFEKEKKIESALETYKKKMQTQKQEKISELELDCQKKKDSITMHFAKSKNRIKDYEKRLEQNKKILSFPLRFPDFLMLFLLVFILLSYLKAQVWNFYEIRASMEKEWNKDLVSYIKQRYDCCWDLYYKGEKEFQEKEWDKALAFYSQSQSLKVSNAPKDLSKRMERALQEKQYWLLCTQAEKALQDNEWDKSVSLFKDAQNQISHAPKDLFEPEDVSKKLEFLSEKIQQISHAKETYKIKNCWDSYYKGNEAFQNKEWDKALAFYKKAQSFDIPNPPEDLPKKIELVLQERLYWNLYTQGENAFQEKDWRGALEFYKKAQHQISHAPKYLYTSEEITSRLDLLLEKMQQIATKIREEETKKISDQCWDLYYKAEKAFQKKDWHSALKLYKEAQSLKAHNAPDNLSVKIESVLESIKIEELKRFEKANKNDQEEENDQKIITHLSLQCYLGEEEKDWFGAQLWVNRLAVHGGGWRMPTKWELQNLYQSKKLVFKFRRAIVWTAEVDRKYGYGVGFDFLSGEERLASKRVLYSVLAVRDKR